MRIGIRKVPICSPQGTLISSWGLTAFSNLFMVSIYKKSVKPFGICPSE